MELKEALRVLASLEKEQVDYTLIGGAAMIRLATPKG
jgi:hypothetical protein